MIKVIGIDPGLAATGIGIVRGIESKVDGFSYGSINTSKTFLYRPVLTKFFPSLS